MTLRTLVVFVALVLQIPAAAQPGDTAAPGAPALLDAHAEAFLDGLTDVREDVVGSYRFDALLAGQPVGQVTLGVATHNYKGTPCYALDTQMKLGGGPRTQSMNIRSYIAADLKLLYSEQTEKEGGAITTSVTVNLRGDDQYNEVESQDGKEEVTTYGHQRGLMYNGVEALVFFLFDRTQQRAYQFPNHDSATWTNTATFIVGGTETITIDSKQVSAIRITQVEASLVEIQAEMGGEAPEDDSVMFWFGTEDGKLLMWAWGMLLRGCASCRQAAPDRSSVPRTRPAHRAPSPGVKIA